MKLKSTKYKTLTGFKEVVELPTNKYGKFIVYQNREPKFFVDCFDFKIESNLVLNSLLLSQGKTVNQVLRRINKRKNAKLSIETPPFLVLDEISEMKDFQLEPLPIEWLN